MQMKDLQLVPRRPHQKEVIVPPAVAGDYKNKASSIYTNMSQS